MKRLQGVVYYESIKRELKISVTEMQGPLQRPFFLVPWAYKEHGTSAQMDQVSREKRR